MDDLDGLIEELEAGNCLVEEEASLWAVVEFNQASFWPEEMYGPFTEVADAYAAAVDRARDTAIIGRREMYRVARLTFVTDCVEVPEDSPDSDGPSSAIGAEVPEKSRGGADA